MLVLLHQYTESLGKDANRAFLFNGVCQQQNFTQFNLWILEIRDLLTCTVSVYSLWQLLKRRRRRSYVSFVLNVQSLETNWNLFFSWETHHPQTPTHKWHFFPSLGNLLCMQFGLCILFFSDVMKKAPQHLYNLLSQGVSKWAFQVFFLCKSHLSFFFFFFLPGFASSSYCRWCSVWRWSKSQSYKWFDDHFRGSIVPMCAGVGEEKQQEWDKFK